MPGEKYSCPVEAAIDIIGVCDRFYGNWYALVRNSMTFSQISGRIIPSPDQCDHLAQVTV